MNGGLLNSTIVSQPLYKFCNKDVVLKRYKLTPMMVRALLQCWQFEINHPDTPYELKNFKSAKLVYLYRRNLICNGVIKTTDGLLVDSIRITPAGYEIIEHIKASEEVLKSIIA